MKYLDRILYKFVDNFNLRIRRRKTIENLSAIYVGEKKETIEKRYLVEKLTSISVIVLVMVVLIFLMLVSDGKQIKNGEIYRPRKGELDKEFYIEAIIDHKKIPITFSLAEPRLSHEEIQEMFKEADKSLVSIILNQNKDLNQVRTKLNLVRNIPNSKITVKWTSSNPLIVDYLGNVSNEDVNSNGVEVTLNATLDYNSTTIEQTYLVKVMPPLISEEEQQRIKILEQITKEDDKSVYEEKIKLPNYIGEQEVDWSESGSNKFLKIIGLLVFIIFAVYRLKDYQLEEKVKERKQQMLIDYSEIVSKLSLLINAGLTTGAAIQKIASDYSSNRSDGKKKRYAYEELVLCCAGLNNGMTEQEVLEKYGYKCQMQEYLMLTSVLNQNIKKGTDQMCQTLDELTLDAFSNKKAIAKMLGEKASTKLLIPMMLLLIIVLLIVVVPTIMSIRI